MTAVCVLFPEAEQTESGQPAFGEEGLPSSHAAVNNVKSNFTLVSFQQ